MLLTVLSPYSFISASSPFILTHPGCAQGSSGTKLLLVSLDFAVLFDLRTFAHTIACLELEPLQLIPTYSSEFSLAVASYSELSLKPASQIW